MKPMNPKKENGFFHLITYILIFGIFAFTIYACLDVLDLIDVPEEYSVAKWISNHSKKIVIEQIDEPDTDKKIKIQIENKQEPSNTKFVAPQMNDFASSEIEKDYKNTHFSYYNQLDEYAKIIYEELEKNLEKMKTGTYNVQFGTTFDDLLHKETGEETLNNSFQLAINALNFDNPELFYIDISKVYLLTKISTKLWVTTYEVEIGASQGQSYLNDSFASEAEVNRAIREVENEKQKIKATLNGSLENQIKGVHDYLVDNLEYDSTISKDNIYNIYGALINHITVCEGYARSFKAMMDELGVPCLIACGTAVNSAGENESHAWNYVRLNGKWYAMDVTWDDPVIIGNGYVSKNVKYKYYLKGSKEFFANHVENGEIVGNANFKYPSLNLENY